MKKSQKTMPAVKAIDISKIKFDPSLFVPIKTGTAADTIISHDGGFMPATKTLAVGDPGVGKSTVLLDLMAGIQQNKKKTLFISAEMGKIHLIKYAKRFPKFNTIPMLFMEDYLSSARYAIETILQDGWDTVLVDSWAEVIDLVKAAENWREPETESWFLELINNHAANAANDAKKNTAFVVIQQVTKSGEFAGSNRLKHMVDSMMHIKFEDRNSGKRYITYSKNRDGAVGEKLYFNLNAGHDVRYEFGGMAEFEE